MTNFVASTGTPFWPFPVPPHILADDLHNLLGFAAVIFTVLALPWLAAGVTSDPTRSDRDRLAH
jgi:hypothetical protein